MFQEMRKYLFKNHYSSLIFLFLAGAGSAFLLKNWSNLDSLTGYWGALDDI
jgi:hypothetical protein